jgi:hypothetical protein
MVVTLDLQTAQHLETFQALDYTERELVTQTLKQFTSPESVDPAATTLAESIAGKSYTRIERLRLEMETLAQHFQHRRQLLDSALSATQVAQLLGTSRQTPHDRVSSQTLLAIRENGKLCFPAWQFDPTGADGTIDGFPAILKALQVSDYSKLNWLTRPNPFLDGFTPIEALKRGHKDRVLAEAEAVGES